MAATGNGGRKMGAGRANDESRDDPNEWQTQDWVSLSVTLVLAALCIGAAIATYDAATFFVAALALGGLGGLVHELAQSHGTLLFFRRYEDGLYLGAVAGLLLGVVAGALVVQSHLTVAGTLTGATRAALAYAAFLAGLSLKGITEAASGVEVPETPKPDEIVDEITERLRHELSARAK